MEAAAFTFAVVALAGQLYDTVIRGYAVVESVGTLGIDIVSAMTDIRVQRERLRIWGEARGLNSIQNPADPRYKLDHLLVYEILAIMSSLLVDADVLQSKYGGSRSPSPNPQTGLAQSQTNKKTKTEWSRRPQFARGRSSKSSLDPHQIQEQVLIQTGFSDSVAKDRTGLDSLGKIVTEIKDKLSVREKIFKGLPDKEKLEKLAQQLDGWNNKLEQLMPSAGYLGPNGTKSENYTIPPKPPFSRNHGFCGRKKTLDEIKNTFWPGQLGMSPSQSSCLSRKVVTLHGLGGIGKSQIASEYGHQYPKSYTAMFWINADDSSTLNTSARSAIGEVIRYYAKLWRPEANCEALISNSILGGSDPISSREQLWEAIEKTSPVKVLKDWLSKEHNGGWLLLIDNYDDPNSLDLLTLLLPTTDFGHVIITTRAQSLSRGFNVTKAITIPEIDLEEGIEMLAKSSQKEYTKLSEEDIKYAGRIVKLVFGLPLALDQVGAYIHNLSQSFKEYAERLEEDPHCIFDDKADVYKSERGAVGAVWEISFERLQAVYANAAELLVLCSYVGNEDIPLELLERGKDKISWMQGKNAIKKALQKLISFSFVKRRAEDDSYWIHPLIHAWVRVRDLKKDPKHKLVASMVTSTFVLGESREKKEWTYERGILPHINRCFEIFDSDLAPAAASGMDEETRTIAYGLAGVYANLGDFKKADSLYRRALSGDKKDSVAIQDLEMMNRFGKNLSTQGNYDEALEWYERALSGMEQTIGPRDLSTLDSVPKTAALSMLDTIHNTAVLFMKQAKYKEAVKEYNLALEGQKKILGDTHPSTLETQHRLAEALKALGEEDKALELFKQVREVRETALGEDHPLTLDTVHAIATILENQGKYDEALDDYQQVLEIQMKILGENHPSTVETIHSIASVYEHKAQYEKALVMANQALDGFRKIFGNTHRQTLYALSYVADILYRQGKYDDALGMYMDLYDSWRKPGAGHEPVDGEYMAACDVGRSLNQKGQYKEALVWFKKAEEGYRKAFGEDDGRTLSAKYGIVSVLEAQGQYERAITLWSELLEKYTKRLGPEHPHRFTVMCGMAGALNKQGLYKESLECYEKAAEGQKKAVGEDHPLTFAAIQGIGNVYENQGMYDEALERYVLVKEGLEKALGAEHRETLTAVYWMGSVMEKKGNHEEALVLYRRAQTGWEKSLGKDHMLSLTVVHSIGNVFEHQGNYDKALVQYEYAGEGYKKEFGKEHPWTYQTACSKGSIFVKTRKYKEAGNLYRETLERLEYSLGKNHPLTLTAAHGMASAFAKQKRYTDSLRLYRRALKGRELLLGKEHPETIQSRKKISRVKIKKAFRWML